VLLATLGAFTGDVVTFGICRFGGPAAVRWVARGQHADRIAEVREQFRRHGWQIIVTGRLLPAGRIPVLVAAGALAYPWRRLLPASLGAGLVWAVSYTLLGVVSGGIFDSPLLATLVATVLVLVVGAVLNLVSAARRRRSGRAPGSAPASTDPPAGPPVEPPAEPATDASTRGPAGAVPGRRAGCCRPAGCSPASSSPGPPPPSRWSPSTPG
jgi:hypothetical protein